MEKVRKLATWGGDGDKDKDAKDAKDNKEKEKEPTKDTPTKEKEPKEGGSRFGGFFATMRGPKQEDIVLSAPSNPRHIGHVGWDAVNGFEVRFPIITFYYILQLISFERLLLVFARTSS